jgi:hypothetical protein
MSYVCPYVGVRVVSWTGGHLGVHARERAALDGGLHDMLSTAAAWPVKRAARGPHRRAPGTASPAGVATAAERAAAAPT